MELLLTSVCRNMMSSSRSPNALLVISKSEQENLCNNRRCFCVLIIDIFNCALSCVELWNFNCQSYATNNWTSCIVSFGIFQSTITSTQCDCRFATCHTASLRHVTFARKLNYFNFTRNAKRSLEQSANAEFVMLISQECKNHTTYTIRRYTH